MRNATINDLDLIMDIEETSFDWFDRFPKKLFLYYLHKFEDGFFVVLDPSASIVGYAIFAETKNVAYILSIAVHPKSRSQGYAKLLLMFLESKCHEKRLTKLRLDVRVDNTVAIELYKKLGLVGLQKKRDFYGDGIDALMMEKQVSASAKPN